jgi:hypothetical protein
MDGLAMHDFAYDFVRHEEPNGHASHFGGRVFGKVVSSLHGLVITAPLGILTLQVCDDILGNNWILGYPEFDFYHYLMIASITCYLLPKWMGFTTDFERVFNRKHITRCTDIHNRFTREKVWNLGPRDDYRIDRLIRFIEKQQDSLDHLHPAILWKIEELLDSPLVEG